MKYKVNDWVRLKRPHSEGDSVRILEVLKKGYKIYIPYWDYFVIFDKDILGLNEEYTKIQHESETDEI